MYKDKIVVLVVCEESGRVATAFREQGVIAYSLDIKKTSDDKNIDYHIIGDAITFLKNGYSGVLQNGKSIKLDHIDILIAHPPCTYLSVAGNSWLKDNPERYKKRDDALEFFKFFAIFDKIPYRCVENPVGYVNTAFEKPTQIIHPYYFGDMYMKRTCLWLYGLKPLKRTHNIEPDESFYTTYKNGKRVSKFIHDLFFYCKGDKECLHTERSKTSYGIAKQMAKQFLSCVINDKKQNNSIL